MFTTEQINKKKPKRWRNKETRRKNKTNNRKEQKHESIDEDTDKNTLIAIKDKKD